MSTRTTSAQNASTSGPDDSYNTPIAFYIMMGAIGVGLLMVIAALFIV